MPGEEPSLPFFRFRPTGLSDRPPLCSSLQAVETTLFLIALRRFPAALITCAQAIESAIKAGLQIPPGKRLDFRALSQRAGEQIAVASETSNGLHKFREARNDFSHFGFTPKDDARAAKELLATGFPYLETLYKGFFSFDLQDSLLLEFGRQYGIAKSVFGDAHLGDTGKEPWAFISLGHVIRYVFHPTFISDVEYEILEESRTTMEIHDYMDRKRHELENDLGTCWFFTCPICDETRSLGAELDDEALKAGRISLARIMCLSCGFGVPAGVPLLADRVCAEEISAEADELLRGFGIR